jgi:hypothetical protein
VTTKPQCVCCSQPMADGAYACQKCGRELAQALTEAAGHAEDAWTVIARETRYGTAGGARKAEPEPAAPASDQRRNRVSEFGWAASIETPARGALRSGQIPPDLSASTSLADVGNVVTTWARHICERRGAELPARRPLLGPLCAAFPCEHTSCERIQWRVPPSDLGEAAAWLATQLGWLRKRPEAGEAFDELTDACRMLRRLVDRPVSDRRLVGVCDCGTTLYALPWQGVVECPDKRCGLRWDVEESRDILRDALRGKLFTAAEAAHLGAFWDERASEQIRKLINKWAERGRLIAHGQVDGAPTFLFGEVIDRLAESPRRTQEVAA